MVASSLRTHPCVSTPIVPVMLMKLPLLALSVMTAENAYPVPVHPGPEAVPVSRTRVADSSSLSRSCGAVSGRPARLPSQAAIPTLVEVNAGSVVFTQLFPWWRAATGVPPT